MEAELDASTATILFGVAGAADWPGISDSRPL
jgi:hypothetical protein